MVRFIYFYCVCFLATDASNVLEKASSNSCVNGQGRCSARGGSSVLGKTDEKTVSMMQRSSAKADVFNPTSEDLGLYRGGSIVRTFLLRDGLQPVDADLDERQVHLIDAETFQSRADLKARCPEATRLEAVVLDAGSDAVGGIHWVLRLPVGGRHDGGSNFSLLHVAEATGEDGMRLLRFSPTHLCNGGLALPQLQGGPAPKVMVDEPTSIRPSNELVLLATREIKKEIGYHLELCKTPGPLLESIEVLSAVCEVIDGVEIGILGMFHFAGKEPVFHRIVVNFEVHANSPGLVPAVVLPTGADWCHLHEKTSDPHASALEDAAGSGATRHYMSMLGYLGAYRDGGPNPDMLLTIKKATCPQAQNLPHSYSLRSHSDFGRCFKKEAVMNQGGCGSCWAYAAAASNSGRACMIAPDDFDVAGGRKQFSTQYVLSCNEDKQGCEGGWMTVAHNAYKKGIPFMANYPYSPSTNGWPWHSAGKNCEWGLHPKPWRVTEMVRVVGEEGMMKELVCNGPFSVAFQVYMNFFSTKKKVYMEASGDKAGGHAVTLTGYGQDENAVKYWELMNSWSSGWGDDGFCKFRRGVNLCNIESWGVIAASVERTDASWVYDEWSACSESEKKRGIKCVSHSDTSNVVDDQKCPLKGGWPDKSTFPRDLGKASKEFAEMKPMAIDECYPVEKCNADNCNGHGDASVVDGKCVCSCAEGYAGESCHECAPNYDNYPACNLKCTRADCNQRGDATGEKWVNEFGEALDSCSCACDNGWQGAKCETRANCVRDTGASCLWWCSLTRGGAKCDKRKCMCPEGKCAWNGRCG